jgi:hypothetical protein
VEGVGCLLCRAGVAVLVGVVGLIEVWGWREKRRGGIKGREERGAVR